MSDAFTGGFRLCPRCGAAVADDRLELHDQWHDSLDTELDHVSERLASAKPAALDVREWPEQEPDSAPTEPVATPPHRPEPEPLGDLAAPDDGLRDFARF